MSKKGLSATIVLIALICAQAPVRGYTLQYRDSAGIVARRWLVRSIVVAFSSSLSTPQANIKPGSDVIGAARRALDRWTSVADIQFVETRSNAQTVSPANAGDRVNLITASAENAGLFGASENPGRTRVFSDSGGSIVEGDIALNPRALFSSDGTPGTYDLESTFTHEVGHILGLEHSAVIGATMQPRQALNGTYGLPAFTQRTLSADDIAGARTLYGSKAGTGSVSGRLIGVAVAGSSQPIFGAHVFAEDISTGRIVAGSVTLASGEYRLDALAPGDYRLIAQNLDGPIGAADIAPAGGSYAGLLETKPFFRSLILAGRNLSQSLTIQPNSSALRGSFVQLNSSPVLRPQLIGMNGELSTAALPVEPGKKITVYVGGAGLDQVAANGISTSSPFISVDPATVMEEQFDTDYPVISFEITIAADAPPGDYSLGLQTIDGEISYLPGALTIDSEMTFAAPEL